MLGEYAKFCQKGGNASQIFVNFESLKFHIDYILTMNDSYIAHEYLEAFNNPIYFKDFADSLEKTISPILPKSGLRTFFSQIWG